MTRGQQTMATAILYPEAKHGGDRKSAGSSSAAELENVAKSMLSRARTVLRDRDEQLREAETNGGGAPFDRPHGAALIYSENTLRRNWSAGQRVMSVAMLYPEAKRGMHSELRGEAGTPPSGSLSKCRAVLRFSSELADAVMLDEQPLSAQPTVTAYCLGPAPPIAGGRNTREMALGSNIHENGSVAISPHSPSLSARSRMQQLKIVPSQDEPPGFASSPISKLKPPPVVRVSKVEGAVALDATSFPLMNARVPRPE
jgi:hypothetical protein